MIRRPITIINKLGLHARATAKLVATASEFESSVRINGKGRDVDAKNIMQVMMLAASQAPTWNWLPMGRMKRPPSKH